MKTTFLIHESNYMTFRGKLQDLNKKFQKKGLPVINGNLSESEEKEMVEVTLTSEFDQANIKGIDVKFEGVVDLVEQEENSKVFKLTNPALSKMLQNCECDECHKKIGRNKYIVFSKVGKEPESREDLIVLGSQCAKNYFPFDIQSYFSSVSHAFIALGDYDEFSCGCFSHMANTMDLDEFFSGVCAVTDNFKVYHKEGVTRDDAINWVNNIKVDKKGTHFRDLYPMPDNAVDFETMKEWLKETYLSDSVSDFNQNARSALFSYVNGEYSLRVRIQNKYLGIVAYAFIGAKKNHGKLEEKKLAEQNRLAENAKVEFFGQPGDKFEKELIFDKSFGFENQFGFSYILLFHDSDNHVFKWSTSNGAYKVVDEDGGEFWCEYQVGRKYLIKGSIKEHSEYKGLKQTVITRCKVLNDFIERKWLRRENGKIYNFEESDISKAMDELEKLGA